MSWAARMKQVCIYRYALEVAKPKIVLCRKIAALHTTSTTGKDIEVDVEKNIFAMGSSYVNGNRERLKQNVIDRRADLDADVLVSTFKIADTLVCVV